MCDCEMVNKGQYNSAAEKHGMKNTKIYQTWKSMKGRCFSRTQCKEYYRDKGIMVCKQWSSFLQFYRDMGDKPAPEYSIDRIDNGKGYCPHNCRWATKQQQSSNRDYCNRNDIRAGKLPLGVKKQTKANTYYASIRHNKEYYYLGSFKTPEEANAAYLKKKDELGA